MTTKHIFNILSLKNSIICIFMLSLCTLGCSKMVDVGLPKNQVTTEAAFSSNDQATSVIAGLYSQLMTNSGSKTFSNGGVTLYCGLSADEIESYQAGAMPTDYEFYTNKILKDNGVSTGTFWSPAFKIIYGCNAAIEGIASSTSVSLDNATRKQLTGEAKFIRAFCYFYLVNLYGDLPLVLTTDFNTTAKLNRSPQAVIYAQIVSDLKDAQNNLPGNYTINPNNERIRANKWAATALLARTYLYLKDWGNAEAQATSVIGDSQFGMPALENVFLKASTETIFALKQNTTKIPYAGTYDANAFVPTTLLTSYPAASQASIMASAATYASTALLFFPLYNMTPELGAAFENGDQRRVKWTQNWPSPNFPPYNARTFYTPYKYKLKAGAASAVGTEFYTVLRLSEQYLIRAEARAQLNNLSGCATDLQAVRSRTGLGSITPTSQPQMLAAVAQENRIEFFAEWGHRWLDLKRTGKAGEVLSLIPTKQVWSDTQLLYPIPTADVTNNPSLIQNPGYE